MRPAGRGRPASEKELCVTRRGALSSRGRVRMGAAGTEDRKRKLVVMRTLVQRLNSVTASGVRPVHRPDHFPMRRCTVSDEFPAGSLRFMFRTRSTAGPADYREKPGSGNPADEAATMAATSAISIRWRRPNYCGAAIFFGAMTGTFFCRMPPTKQRFFASARAVSSLPTSSLARGLSRKMPPLSPGICL